MITIFTHPQRPTQMLIKVTPRVGDDLWILTNGHEMGTMGPTSREKALRHLTPENGWTPREIPYIPFPASEDIETAERLPAFPTDEAISKAVEGDLQQFFTDSLTPDRGYPCPPTTHVKALLKKHVPSKESSSTEVAKFLAETFEPSKIREIYGELHKFLPHKTETETAEQTAEILQAVDQLDIQNKESIVNLLFLVQNGYVSCRRAATQILAKINPNPTKT